MNINDTNNLNIISLSSNISETNSLICVNTPGESAEHDISHNRNTVLNPTSTTSMKPVNKKLSGYARRKLKRLLAKNIDYKEALAMCQNITDKLNTSSLSQSSEDDSSLDLRTETITANITCISSSSSTSSTTSCLEYNANLTNPNFEDNINVADTNFEFDGCLTYPSSELDVNITDLHLNYGVTFINSTLKLDPTNSTLNHDVIVTDSNIEEGRSTLNLNSETAISSANLHIGHNADLLSVVDIDNSSECRNLSGAARKRLRRLIAANVESSEALVICRQPWHILHLKYPHLAIVHGIIPNETTTELRREVIPGNQETHSSSPITSSPATAWPSHVADEVDSVVSPVPVDSVDSPIPVNGVESLVPVDNIASPMPIDSAYIPVPIDNVDSLACINGDVSPVATGSAKRKRKRLSGAARKKLKRLMRNSWSKPSTSQLSLQLFNDHELPTELSFEDQTNSLTSDSSCTRNDANSEITNTPMDSPTPGMSASADVFSNSIDAESSDEIDGLQRVALSDKSPMSDKKLKLIHDKLIDAIISIRTDYSPAFRGYKFIKGRMFLACENNETVKWLKIALTKIKIWSGAQISIIPEKYFVVSKDLPKSVVWYTFIPYSVTNDTTEGLRMLKAQNHGLNTEKWRMLDLAMIKNGHLVALVLDNPSIEVLRKTGFKAKISFKTIVFKTKNSSAAS